MKMKLKWLGLTAALALAGNAQATILTVFDGITAGVSNFDSTVSAAGGTVKVDVWSGLTNGTSISRTDYTITKNNGGTAGITSYGTLSGQAVIINPFGGGSNPRTNPMDYFDSGMSLTFNDPVNAVGFEVGDWATCCFDPTTDLFISFDDGTPIQVASASQYSDGLYPSQNDPQTLVSEIFVAAFDDSGSFNKVSFWGNGIGEYLVAGGQVRYALLNTGSLPPVPEPAVLALISFGLLGFGGYRLRKTAG